MKPSLTKKERYPKVTVIILTYNNYSLTSSCLVALKKNTYPNIEIVFVDNGSDNKSYQQFHQKFKDVPNISFKRFTNNLGFAKGCNEAVQALSEGYLLFLNNDTEIEKDAIRTLVETAEVNMQVAAMQPKLLYLLDKEFFDYAGGAGGYIDMFGYPFARGRVFTTIEKDVGQYDDRRDIFWASGSAFFIRASIFQEVGGFDTSFFSYAEEVDLCWRLHELGYKIWYEPKAIVYHLGGATFNKHLPLKMFLLHRNHLILLLKHYTAVQLITLLPLRISMDIANVFYYLQKGQVSYLLAIFKSYFSILRNLAQYIKQRNEWNVLKSGRTVVTQIPMYPRSIVWDYFIMKRKTYQEIDKKRRIQGMVSTELKELIGLQHRS